MPFGWDDAILGLGALANFGGGMFSSAGQASANAQNIAMQNMWNQQAMNAQQAQHAQNTAFMEDSQAHQIAMQDMSQRWAETQNNLNRALQYDVFRESNEFQAKMSNTAYQRATADLRAAGLNPVLALMKGGASTAGGGSVSGSSMGASGGAGPMASAAGPASTRSPTVVNDREAISRALGNIVNSAVDQARTLEGIDLMKKQGSLTDQKEGESRAAQRNLDQDTARKAEETKKTAAEVNNVKVYGDLMKAQAGSAAARAAVDAHQARVYSKYDSPTAPTFWERMGRIFQNAAETGQLPPGLTQYAPGGKNQIVSPPGSSNSDFWGTSPKIRERAERNRQRYGR